MMRWRFALRLLVSDWRAGELRILAASLVIAVAASTAIGFVAERMGRGLLNESADFLGADLALASSRAVERSWLAQAGAHHLKLAETLVFASVVVKGDALQLSSIKAVDENFPLRGKIRTAMAPFAQDTAVTGVPTTGEAWAATRLMNRLDLKVGDDIEVGERTLTVTRVLTFEPGQVRDLFGISPRLLINLADVPSTQVVQPGSRLSWQYLFAGGDKDIQAYRKWLKPRLQASHELVGVREGRRAVGSALERAERYLGLSVLAAIVMAGVAVAMSAKRYSERHFDMSAMLRCLGASQNELLGIYLPQLLIVGVLASALGCLLGWLAQFGLLYLLAEVLPRAPSSSSVWPLFAGFATGLVTLAGFALPPVMRLRGVPPLRVIRRELTPMPGSAWLVYGAAAAALSVLMWRYTGHWKLTLSVLAGGIAAAVLLALAGFVLLFLSRKLNRRVGVAWRFGINNLWRRRRSSVSQIMAFGMTLMVMAIIVLVRGDLLATWQRQLPQNAPNNFAFNILPEQVEPLRAQLKAQQVPVSQIYPMVRGRLVSINGRAVRDAVSKEARSDNVLNRELNLTWTMTLQEDNHITAGRWWQEGDQGKAQVSVEAKLAERLGILLNDRLGFSIGGETFTATVESLRSVQWDSFRPNFYMVFPPGFLDAYPATWMTSFYLQTAQKNLLTQLVSNFPAVTILEMDLLISQVNRIFRQVTLAVEYLLLFVLLAGFAVLFAALQSSQDERRYEGALLRALGGSRRQLRSGHLAEFMALGILSGLVAAAGTECLAWLLYTRVLELDYVFKWQVWLLAPLAGALLIGAAGFWGTRVVVNSSPMALLKDA